MTSEPMESTNADAVRRSARQVVERETDLARYRGLRNSLPGIRPEWLSLVRELGWNAVLVPESHGGLGLGLTDTAAIAEELGRGLLGEPLCATWVLSVAVLLHVGPGEARDTLLREIAGGTRTVTLAFAERASGFDVGPFDTHIRTDAGVHWLVGQKRFVVGAAIADTMIVAVREDGGTSLWRVPSSATGVGLEHEWRVDGSPSSTVRYEGVRLRDVDRIAGPSIGGVALERGLGDAAAIAAAEMVGVMSRALEITLEYLRTRVQFGKPLGSFQALQHMAVEMFLQRELASACLSSVLATLDDPLADPATRALAASRAKARCADACLRVTRDALQLHGAMGFTDECDVGLYLKRAMTLSAWLGTATVHRRRISDQRSRISSERAESAELQAELRTARDRIMALPPQERDWESLDDETFRRIAADFFASNLPPSLRYLPRRPTWVEVEPWYRALSEAAWLAPAWPASYGGMGLGASKLMVYSEEMGRSGAPRHLEQGINYIGPLLIARGTEAQKAHFLPRILTGEHLWCQGYSEPNAGSDLASLRTRARIDGDEFFIDGEKVWTTMAHHANHIYVLARTSDASAKQGGISLILVDMRQPGVKVRPIRNIKGHEEFCQVRFERARAPLANLVGELDQGWQVSRALLGFERNTVGSPRQCQLALERLDIVARASSFWEDPGFVDRTTSVWMDVADLAALYARFVQSVRDGATPGHEVSVMKIWATETLQRVTELTIEAAGERGAIAGRQVFGERAMDIVMPFLDARSVTISAGSSQVQRNVIAKRVLNL
jgi:alkylation response protein AidB-like acyl-CoA dehydrogenase